MLVCLAWSEYVGCFSVDHIATRDEFLLSHSKRDAEHVFNEAEDEGSPDYIPTNDKECTDDSAFVVSREYYQLGM